MIDEIDRNTSLGPPHGQQLNEPKNQKSDKATQAALAVIEKENERLLPTFGDKFLRDQTARMETVVSSKPEEVKQLSVSETISIMIKRLLPDSQKSTPLTSVAKTVIESLPDFLKDYDAKDLHLIKNFILSAYLATDLDKLTGIKLRRNEVNEYDTKIVLTEMDHNGNKCYIEQRFFSDGEISTTFPMANNCTFNEKSALVMEKEDATLFLEKTVQPKLVENINTQFKKDTIRQSYVCGDGNTILYRYYNYDPKQSSLEPEEIQEIVAKHIDETAPKEHSPLLNCLVRQLASQTVCGAIYTQLTKRMSELTKIPHTEDPNAPKLQFSVSGIFDMPNQTALLRKSENNIRLVVLIGVHLDTIIDGDRTRDPIGMIQIQIDINTKDANNLRVHTETSFLEEGPSLNEAFGEEKSFEGKDGVSPDFIRKITYATIKKDPDQELSRTSS